MRTSERRIRFGLGCQSPDGTKDWKEKKSCRVIYSFYNIYNTELFTNTFRFIRLISLYKKVKKVYTIGMYL